MALLMHLKLPIHYEISTVFPTIALLFRRVLGSILLMRLIAYSDYLH